MARRGNLEAYLNLSDTLSQPETVQVLSIDQIVLCADQPRRYFDPDKLEQLAKSIKAHGILEPLLVRPLTATTYELVAGERRYRAAQLLNLLEVPVTVRHLNNEDALAVALIENLQRENLNPVEETEAILRLLALQLRKDVASTESFLYQLAAQKKKATHNVMGEELELIEALFATLGQQWLSFVSNKLPLLHLSEDILGVLRQGKIAYTKAIAISRVKDEAQRLELLDVAIAENWSLAQIQKYIRDLQAPGLSKSPAEDKLTKTYNQLSKLKLWQSDPQKWKAIEQLIDEIENLINA